MISLFLWRSFKNLKRWFSYRNDKNSEVFLRWFSFSEMSFFQKIQAMIFTFQWPQFLCLKISLFNDKENDIRSVMIRGKSPLLPKWGSRASHKRERTSRKEAPIIPKCRFRLSYRKWSSLSFRNACDKSKSKSNIILNDFFKWCPFSSFQNDDAVIIPKWPWDKSVKKICYKSVPLPKWRSSALIPKWQAILKCSSFRKAAPSFIISKRGYCFIPKWSFCRSHLKMRKRHKSV